MAEKEGHTRNSVTPIYDCCRRGLSGGAQGSMHIHDKRQQEQKQQQFFQEEIPPFLVWLGCAFRRRLFGIAGGAPLRPLLLFGDASQVFSFFLSPY